MDKASLNMLTAAERALVAQTETKHLRQLDEDELGELHARVRRARNKYSKLHRRQASAQVVADSARGAGLKKNRRTAAKAEIFEGALARVSQQLAAAARKSAADLRAERLEVARASKGAPPRGDNRSARRAASTDGAATATTRGGDAGLASPASKRATASTRATGARRQAKRDSR